MLVLSRQRDESIMIGDSIVVTIVDIRGDKVRLGINAPAEVPVHRQEVYEAIQRENLRASRLAPEQAEEIGKLAGRGPVAKLRQGWRIGPRLTSRLLSRAFSAPPAAGLPDREPTRPGNSPARRQPST